MLQKNDLVRLSIVDLGTEGEGIGHVDGYPLFVKDTVIGDEIEARVTKTNKTYGYGHLEKVLIPSPDRVDPVCPVAKTCGGCQLQAMSYNAQLRFKERKVRENLRRLGGLDTVESVMNPILGMEDPWNYRNKAQFPVDDTLPRKERQLGFFAQHSHRIVPCGACAINMDGIQALAREILAHGPNSMRHILVRKSFANGKYMVCMVVRDPRCLQDKRLKNFAARLVEEGRAVSVSISINERKDNVILGDNYHVLAGEAFLTDRIGEPEFEISPLSFYQVNPVQTGKLYETALAYAGLTGKEVVWDLYCGIGTISLFLARDAGAVYGVEVVPQAIENAKRNAVRNGITNAYFYAGHAKDVRIRPDDGSGFEGEADSTRVNCAAGGAGVNPDNRKGISLPRPDVIVVDPPRKGCDPELIATMLKAAPERIVYVSCDSATLARDIRLLREGNPETGVRYDVQVVQPVDMFPQTVHVETAVLMSRSNHLHNSIV